jgi:hypothetical protein
VSTDPAAARRREFTGDEATQRKESTMQLRVWLIAAVVFALLAAACGDAASAGGGGSATLDITTPADARPARHPDADRQQVASFSNVSHPERRDQ